MKKYLTKRDIEYLIKRRKDILELLKFGEIHMASAKILADIAMLKATIKGD